MKSYLSWCPVGLEELLRNVWVFYYTDIPWTIKNLDSNEIVCIRDMH